MTAGRLRGVGPWGALVVGLLLAGCGSAGQSDGRSSTARSTSTLGVPTSTSMATSTSTSTSPPVSSDTSAPATAPSPVTEPIPMTAPPVTPIAATPSELDRAGLAGQAVVVTAAAYGSTTADLSTWQRAATGAWEQVQGPWPAHVGRAGFAPPGEKREGDGRTPSGTYGFEFAFGVQADPGAALPYRRVTGPSIVWDDHPASPSYNLWVDGGAGEAMYQSPAYDHGAVIAYNTARTPGLGSAIFLHVSTGGPTAGCVALPVDRLVEVLRWLDPARSPVIVMGVA